MRHLRHAAVVIVILGLAGGAWAGLHYSGEPVDELPSQWRGFLLDQRALRNVALKPTAGTPPNPLRTRYEEAAANLEKTARQRQLTADELADLGALYIRLGEPARAVELLRSAQREYPHHYRIVSNLGTAWQLQGDLDQAAACLQEAVRLAPGKLQKAEEYQLKLVRLRQRQPRDSQELDDLFGVRFVGESGKFEPGKLAAAERQKLPADAVAIVQQLALWLPADGRLLWLLGELANAHGDVRTAASIFEGCVTEFGMRHPELRQRRQAARAAADELAKTAGAEAKAAHEGHAGVLKTRSQRPLLTKLDPAALPPVSDTGVNVLPWAVLNETTIDRQFRPTFPKYLQQLNGKQVTLSGFMQPLGDELEMSSFMLVEYPIGCWYCEMPELTGLVLVELPPDKVQTYTRGLIKVTGRLVLNATDPEDFLYTIRRAEVKEAN
ncbi:MAG TPA: tetratricopeptide repeat protein [Gemmataceae bacterium]|nr:tetratricopeptide repeat protein [Gemmataceae bacterium]